jgi:transposase
MKTKTPQLDWREGRRQRAWELKEQGWKQQDIAAALGVTAGAVSQWLKRAREQGVEALRRHPAPGRQPRLMVEQLAQLPNLLERGPEAYGFRGQVWTCQRVAEVIRRTFGVRYHPAHVSRLLHAVRHSVQRPIQRAAQRDVAAIQAWWRERWPALEKKKRPTKGGPLSGSINRGSICYP